MKCKNNKHKASKTRKVKARRRIVTRRTSKRDQFRVPNGPCLIDAPPLQLKSPKSPCTRSSIEKSTSSQRLMDVDVDVVTVGEKGMELRIKRVEPSLQASSLQLALKKKPYKRRIMTADDQSRKKKRKSKRHQASS